MPQPDAAIVLTTIVEEGHPDRDEEYVGRHRSARIVPPIREGRTVGNVELHSAFVTMVKATDTRPRYNFPSPCAAHSPFRSLLLESTMGAIPLVVCNV